MEISKLSDIFIGGNYETDKYDLGYIDNFYDDFLVEFKDKPINFMEIGVDKSGSIKLWKDYFHEKTNIFAADINYFTSVPGTTSIIGNMYSYDEVLKFSDNYFDLIIDDGPHTFESFVLLIQRYFSRIKLGGFLIVEDIIESFWVEPLVKLSQSVGYSSCEVIHMGGKQKTDDLYRRWKSGLFILKIAK